MMGAELHRVEEVHVDALQHGLDATCTTLLRA
jgi:hypothetical protein